MGWLCACLAALAAFWMTPAAPVWVSRGHRSRRRCPGGGDGLAGRLEADAPSLARRLLLGAGADTALCLVGATYDGGPGRWSWLVWPGLTIGCVVVLGRLSRCPRDGGASG
jgi:hypothetical protein